MTQYDYIVIGAGSAGAPVAAEGSGSAALPTQDVVSGIQADAVLKAELPAAIAARGTLLLGTPQPTGLSGLPHDGVDGTGKEVGLDVDLRTGLDIESDLFAALFATDDRRIGMASFVENGPGKAEFTGH